MDADATARSGSRRSMGLWARTTAREWLFWNHECRLVIDD